MERKKRLDLNTSYILTTELPHLFEKVFEREYNLLFPLFTILKLISKPHSLLLENQGGETGSKGHSSTVKLLLWAKLNLCVVKNNIKLCGKKKTAGLKYKLYSDY